MSENEAAIADPQASNIVVATPDPVHELEAFNKIVSAIKSVTGEDAQVRVVKSALTFLGWADTFSKRISGETQRSSDQPANSATASQFSEDRNISAKEFILSKKPMTDIERVACLAYYLTHYRDTPHFKTLDISKLNTDAAQIKLSNAAAAVENAAATGLLVAAGKGNKQLSAVGELYVQSLPDRDAAKAAIAHVRPKRKNKRNEGGAKQNEDDAK